MENKSKDLKEKLLDDEEQKVAKGENSKEIELKRITDERNKNLGSQKTKAQQDKGKPMPRGI